MFRFDEITKKYATVFFNYSESCRNVYKSFGVKIDGKKSNLTGLKKFLSNPDDIPDIIRANTYFWNSGGSASTRRYNEKRRNSEVTEWLESEGFSESINLNPHVSGRRRGENVGIDSQGYFLSKFGEKYHWEKFKDINIKAGRREIKKRVKMKKALKRLDTLVKNKPRTLVTFEDSAKAGNCRIGTESFRNGTLLNHAKKRLPGVKKIKSVSVSYLLSVRNDDFTKRAVAIALNR